MTDLIIVQGDEEYRVFSNPGTTYLYRIGSGKIVGRECLLINNSNRLSEIAENIRDEYSEWIHSFNAIFQKHRFVHDDLSLFFVSDLSCKRTEIFDTFNIVCNCILIEEILRDVDIDHLILFNSSASFRRAIYSVFPVAKKTNHNPINNTNLMFRRFLSNVRFLSEIAVVGVLNLLTRDSIKEDISKSGRYFFSIYPKMTASNGIDSKYGDLVGIEDKYAVSIVSDGMHQHATIRRYLRWKKSLPKQSYALVDSFIRPSDCLKGIYNYLRLFLFSRGLVATNYKFRRIDISGYIKDEIGQSVSRINRLILLGGVFDRFCQFHQPKEFVYYLHEYALGRMISWVLASKHPRVLKIGFQHGPASWRKLLYFLAPTELASANSPFLERVPIPDQIMAEDQESKLLYEYSGYRNVQVMEKVGRLEYLDKVNVSKHSRLILIAPGLHDGLAMMRFMRARIELKEDEFVVKPHPLANNLYLSEFSDLSNLEVSFRPIFELLSIAGIIFVTYSSVGVEAYQLGLKVYVINIPGRVNETPLISRDGVSISKQIQILE